MVFGGEKVDNTHLWGNCGNTSYRLLRKWRRLTFNIKEVGIV